MPRFTGVQIGLTGSLLADLGSRTPSCQCMHKCVLRFKGIVSSCEPAGVIIARIGSLPKQIMFQACLISSAVNVNAER